MIGFIKNYLLPLNIIEHVADNYFFDTVNPTIGSVLYVDFIAAASLMQHSGIYIGDGKIVHLNGNGVVEEVSPSDFISGFGGLKCGSSIYVSCNGTTPVGCKSAANTAKAEVGNSYEYSIIKFNCHQFVSNCISGFVSDPDEMEIKHRIISTLTGLKLVCRFDIDINSDNWRVWDR